MAYTVPQQRKEEESERLRGERDQMNEVKDQSTSSSVSNGKRDTPREGAISKNFPEEDELAWKFYDREISQTYSLINLEVQSDLS